MGRAARGERSPGHEPDHANATHQPLGGRVDGTHDPGRPPTSTPRPVLYIEDVEHNVLLMRRLVEGQTGRQLLAASTGGEGIELAVNGRPSLIILDLNLPDISGETVLRTLRVLASTRDLPIVVTSVDEGPRRVRDVLAAGADAFVPKPFDHTVLLEVLERHLAAEV